jgi:hypothetical protein
MELTKMMVGVFHFPGRSNAPYRAHGGLHFIQDIDNKELIPQVLLQAIANEVGGSQTY